MKIQQPQQQLILNDGEIDALFSTLLRTPFLIPNEAMSNINNIVKYLSGKVITNEPTVEENITEEIECKK